MDNENKPIMETEPFDYKEDNSDMKMKLNRSNDDNKKKIIMYVVIGVVVLILILVMIYIVLGNKKNNTTDNKKNDIDIVNKDEDKDKDTNKSNMGYVSCDDNTSLLNVRNSTSGDIIDGLSCYKEVTIEEELPGTDNCKKLLIRLIIIMIIVFLRLTVVRILGRLRLLNIMRMVIVLRGIMLSLSIRILRS